MGTNYYLHVGTCPTCGRGVSEPLHIGKSSAGWCFALHIIPERGIRDLADWEREWTQPGVVIRDEYEYDMKPEEMRHVITHRGYNEPYPVRDSITLAQNHAEQGPRGLMRRQVDGRHCTGHGEGPWDLCPGEFS